MVRKSAILQKIDLHKLASKTAMALLKVLDSAISEIWKNWFAFSHFLNYSSFYLVNGLRLSRKTTASIKIVWRNFSGVDLLLLQIYHQYIFSGFPLLNTGTLSFFVCCLNFCFYLRGFFFCVAVCRVYLTLNKIIY